MILRLKPGESLGFSYERLQLCVAARRKLDGIAHIELAAGIGAAFSSGDAFQKWVDAVMERVKGDGS